MDDLPTDFDVIVVGTGMTESVIAAACSRIGKTVLHLDSNEYYGENWASFNLDCFENWMKTTTKTTEGKPNEEFNNLVNENEKFVRIKVRSNVWNVKRNEFVRKKNEVEEGKKEEVKECEKVEVEEVKKVEVEDGKKEEVEKGEEITEDIKQLECEESEEKKLQKLSRRFNLDLCPKLLFSKGMLVELLISSNIARYAEFKSVSRVLTWRNNHLEPVPCSRADVFATKNVSVVQKRILAKMLNLFANYTEALHEFEGFENKTFLEYLKHKKLPDNLIHYILYAIAMGDNKTGCFDGIKACKSFLESLGRYGNTPFIFSMYGSGELPQCFCRLCAVFGGIYCLQRGVDGLIIKDNKCTGIVTNGKRINATNVILSSAYAPEDYTLNEKDESLTRGIFITDRSVLKGEKDSLTLLQFPPVTPVSDNSVTILELGAGTCTCPENYFVVHMTTKMTKDASTDLSHVVESLFDSGKEDENKESVKPKVLWSATWNVAKRTSQTQNKCPENVRICSNVDRDLDYDYSISEAKRIFSEIYPGEDFLPRAPDPNEIVLDVEEKGDNSGGDENTPKDSVTENEESPKPDTSSEASACDIATASDSNCDENNQQSDS